MNYINNQDFSNALREYRKESLEQIEQGFAQPPIPRYIADCFLAIAQNYSTKFNFARYSFREDMVSEAYITCCEKILKYDANLSPYAFSYFSRICFRVFIDMIWLEKRESYIKAKLYVSSPFDAQMEGDEIGTVDDAETMSNDFIPYFDINEFERKLEEKKEKTKQRAKELAEQRKNSSTASIED